MRFAFKKDCTIQQGQAFYVFPLTFYVLYYLIFLFGTQHSHSASNQFSRVRETESYLLNYVINAKKEEMSGWLLICLSIHRTLTRVQKVLSLLPFVNYFHHIPSTKLHQLTPDGNEVCWGRVGVDSIRLQRALQFPHQ